LRRLEFVYTPKHGLWLNVAENELSVLKRVGISKRVRSRAELEKQVAGYQKRRNKKEVKIDWQLTTEDARVKLKRLYPPINP
jgi:transposase